MDVAFRHLLYDLYSKDLSVKVRSSLAIGKERGQYVSANCPFGYEKTPYDKHMLVIEENEAEIVRRIFSPTLEGYTSVEIAREFNHKGVRTPIEFKIAKGKTSRMPKGGQFTWSSASICSILKNEAYVGDMVYGKTERRTPGGRNILKPRSERKVFRNHHEPIIDRETFETIQQNRGVAYEKGKKERHPLVGTLVCACCGKNMVFRPKGLNPYFRCPSQYADPRENCVKKANVMFLEQYILFEVQQKMLEYEDIEKLREEGVKALEQTYGEMNNKLMSLKTKRKKVEGEKATLYEQYREKVKKGSIELAALEYQEKMEGIAERLQACNAQIYETEQQLSQIEEKLYGRSDVMELDALNISSKLTRDIVRSMIEKIVVFDEQHIEIEWKGFAFD